MTFVGLLWVLSGPVTLPLFGMEITIPGHMVWIAVIYAVVGTYLSYKIGRRLVRINFEQEQYRANFRFGMSRLKENAESIALYGGESDERRGLMPSFGAVWTNWWALMRMQKRLNWFQTFYGQAGGIFPILVIAPRYFAGAIDFGTIFRINQAFGQVADALTWFMDNFVALTAWKATVNRLIGFVEAMDRAKDGPFRYRRHLGPGERASRPQDLDRRLAGWPQADRRSLRQDRTRRPSADFRRIRQREDDLVSRPCRPLALRQGDDRSPRKRQDSVPAPAALSSARHPAACAGLSRRGGCPAGQRDDAVLDAVHLEHLKDRLDEERATGR